MWSEVDGTVLILTKELSRFRIDFLPAAADEASLNMVQHEEEDRESRHLALIFRTNKASFFVIVFVILIAIKTLRCVVVLHLSWSYVFL